MATQKAPRKPSLITVKATLSHGRVALWEQHPDHPNGEVFISGDGRSHQVAKTPGVLLRLSKKELVEVKEK